MIGQFSYDLRFEKVDFLMIYSLSHIVGVFCTGIQQDKVNPAYRYTANDDFSLAALYFSLAAFHAYKTPTFWLEL